MMRKLPIAIALLLLFLNGVNAQSSKWIWQPGSEGPYYDYSISTDDPKEYYDAGGPERGMRGNNALTLLRLKPISANTHITIVFEDIEIGAMDEMRIYAGLITLHNAPNEDGEYVYDWPKETEPIYITKGSPAQKRFVVSSTAPGGELCIAFRCHSTEPGWKGMIYAVKNGAPEPGAQPEVPADISFVISDNLGTDEDDEEITETNVTLLLGADAPRQAIRIDWGQGKGSEEYTIDGNTPASITHAVDAGGQVKIYGHLKLFDASGNRLLTAVKCEGNAKLAVLRLAQNKISRLDLLNLPSLRDLSVTDNQLSAIDISHLAKLEEFYGAWNPYTELRTVMNPLLKVLTCYNTGIKELDLSANTQLEILKAGDNKYESSVDLSHNTMLKSIDLENAGLESLDLLAQTHLSTLLLSGNRLTALPLAQAANLRSIDLSRNRLDACTLTDLFFILPHTTKDNPGTIKIASNVGAAGAGTHWAVKRGWQTDVSGSGDGCETVRIKFESTEHGSVGTTVDGVEVAEWMPIRRGATVVVEPKPMPNYTAGRISFNGQDLTAKVFEATDYGYLSVQFVSVEGVQIISADELSMQRVGDRIILRGLAPMTPFRVFDISGQVSASGTVSREGSISFVATSVSSTLIVKCGSLVYKLDVNG